MDGLQEEAREPIGRIMRKNHLESQIISDLTNRVQTRSSFRSQGHTALI